MLLHHTGFDAETFAHETFAQCSVYVTSRPGEEEGGRFQSKTLRLQVCKHVGSELCVCEGILNSEPDVDSGLSNVLAL